MVNNRLNPPPIVSTNLGKEKIERKNDGKTGERSRNQLSLLNWLDINDKKISRPIFLSRLPWALELVLSVPGNWFGVPFHSTVVIPNITAFFLSHGKESSAWTILVVVVSLISITVSWGVLNGVKKANQFSYNPKIAAISPLIGLLLLGLAEDELGLENDRSAKQLGYFQITTWCLTKIPIILLKNFCKRKRPVAILSYDERRIIGDPDETGGFHRPAKHFLALPSLFLRDPNGSFPSGDTSGAMALMYPFLLHGTKQNKALAVTMVAMSCVGRVYWLAHHIADVSVGLLISFITCRSYEKCLDLLQPLEMKATNKLFLNKCICHSIWWHPIVANLFLIYTVKLQSS